MKDNVAGILKDKYGISEETYLFSGRCEEKLQEHFASAQKIRDFNQLKVLSAIQDCGISERHFAGTSGYGYDDIGRDASDRVYARVFGAEDAMVRSQIVSGTNCLAIALFGILRPGDELLAVTGKPYDTLDTVIGIRPGNGSLKEFGIMYKQIDLKKDGKTDFAEPDYDAIYEAVGPKTKAVHIQRSKGYCYRQALSVDTIGKIAETVKRKNKNTIVFVDNCYGEFTEENEPTEAGADIIVGSLIKNPGGGLALSGGYIAGRKDLVGLCGERMTAPGLGKHVGAAGNATRSIIQGLYFAPHIVCESLMGAMLTASMFEELGFSCSPSSDGKRADIVQAIRLETPEMLAAFCKSIQKAAPIDSFVEPEFAEMPGYDNPVIMAAGSFVQGASIELSADGPKTPPFIAYMQGGLSYINVKLAAMTAYEECRRLKNNFN